MSASVFLTLVSKLVEQNEHWLRSPTTYIFVLSSQLNQLPLLAVASRVSPETKEEFQMADDIGLSKKNIYWFPAILVW